MMDISFEREVTDEITDIFRSNFLEVGGIDTRKNLASIATNRFLSDFPWITSKEDIHKNLYKRDIIIDSITDYGDTLSNDIITQYYDIILMEGDYYQRSFEENVCNGCVCAMEDIKQFVANLFEKEIS